MWKIKISPISICISTQTEIGSTVECRNSTQSVSISISICSRMAIVNSGCAQELPVPSRSLISLFHWYVSNGLGFAIIFSELRFNVRRPIQVFGKSLEFCRCCSCKSVHYQGSMGHITCIVVKVHRISLQPPKTNIKIKVNPTWPKFLWYVWLTRQKKTQSGPVANCLGRYLGPTFGWIWYGTLHDSDQRAEQNCNPDIIDS